MATYTITAVSDQVRDWESTKGGPMKSYRVTLRNQAGAELANVEWARKAASPAPQPGQTIDGEVDKAGQYGPKFKAAQQAGGGLNRGKTAEERRSIAMQASQKTAVEVAKASGQPVTVESVMGVAQQLFAQVQKAEAGQ